MDAMIIDHIPFQVDMEQLLRELHIEMGSQYAGEAQTLAREAEASANPKALYKLAFIESRGENWVTIDGVTFTSRVLRINLDDTHRAFAYVATCGVELDDWAHSIDDMLHRYWAEVIQEIALRSATQALYNHLMERYRPGRTATMSPGRLVDWPLREQRQLFALLGDPQAAIGVQLSDSYLMIPAKSVSGLRFPTEENFESCQLCPRERCPNRQVPYDRDLYHRKYQPQPG